MSKNQEANEAIAALRRMKEAEAKKERPCPSCGHCPTCGRGGYRTMPPWYVPTPYWIGGARWEYVPTFTYSTGTIGAAWTNDASSAVTISGHSDR